MRSWAAQSSRVRGSSFPPLSLRPTPRRHRPPSPAGSNTPSITPASGMRSGQLVARRRACRAWRAGRWPGCPWGGRAIGCARERGSSQEPGSLGFPGADPRDTVNLFERHPGLLLQRRPVPLVWAPARSLSTIDRLRGQSSTLAARESVLWTLESPKSQCCNYRRVTSTAIQRAPPACGRCDGKSAQLQGKHQGFRMARSD
jgi:hypothetical protein